MSGNSHGTSHFWVQRLTAVALIPLTIWFCFSLASMAGMSQENLVAWLKAPFSAALMILVIGVGLYHGKLGMQVILEDYVSDRNIRTIGMGAITLVFFMFAIVGIVSVLKLSLGA